MTISIPTLSLKASLNRANLNTLADQFRQMAIGDFVRSMQTHLRAKAPLAVAAYPYVLQAAVQALALPDDAKGLVIDAVYARAGTGTLGPLTIDATAATAPAAGHCKLGPSGDLLFASADAWTSVDVQYRPNKQDIVEMTLPVVPGTGVCVLPTTVNGVAAQYVSLLEAESLAGGVLSKSIVQPPGAAPGTTKWANLSLDKTQVIFTIADAVTSARVKVGVASLVDVDALLEGTAANQLMFT